MSSPAVSVGPEVTAAAAARLLAEHRLTALWVVEDAELVGIVTEIDLLHGRVSHDARSPLLAAELAAGFRPRTVGDVIAVDVLITIPTTDVADLVEVRRAPRWRATAGCGGRVVLPLLVLPMIALPGWGQGVAGSNPVVPTA